MMDQSILRAHRDRDDSIENERRARVAKMMGKIYEAKITTREKPFIHGMYENYHQKFCKKLKGRYLQQARLAYQKTLQQGGLSKLFGMESAISEHPPSASSDSSNILEDLSQEIGKKTSTSEVRFNQIKKVEFASELKKEIKVNQMMMKKAPHDAESVSKMEGQSRNKQDIVQPKKSLAKQRNEIPRIDISKQAEKEVKRQEKAKKQIAQPAIAKQSPAYQIKIEKKVEWPKSQIKIIKRQPIEPNRNEEDEEQVQVEQDSGPSYYQMTMQAKLNEIDDAVKHVTTSQIMPSKQDKSDIHANSYIASQQPDKQHRQKDAKQDKDQKKPSRKQKMDYQGQVINQILVDTERLEQKKEAVQQIKKEEVLIEPQAKHNNKIMVQQEKYAIERQINSQYYVPILQQLRQQLQDSSSQAQGQQESALSLFTEPEAERSKQEIPQASADQAYPQQLSTEIKQLPQNIQDRNEEQLPQLQIPKVSPQKTQSEDIDRPQIEKQMELPIRDQTEISSKMEPKDILEGQKPVQEIQSIEQKEETHQFNDDVENRIDRIVNSFQDWLNKELPPCEKCSQKEEEESYQQQSQKNQSDRQ